MIQIIPITTEQQLKSLYNEAQEDGHLPMFPTHLVTKPDSKEIVGFVSIDRTPVLYAWLHTKKTSARDSYSVLKLSEQVMQFMGHKAIVIPCAETSPFYEYLPRFGYKPVMSTTLNLRNF